MESAGGGLNLGSPGTGTSFSFNITNCASGFTGSVTQANPTISVYTGDRGCLAKLTSFTSDGVAYTPSATHPFTTWAVGDYTFFQDASLNLVYVVIVSTLGNPLASTDFVLYRFGTVPTHETYDPDMLTVATSGASSGTNVLGASTPITPIVLYLRKATITSITSGNLANIRLSFECIRAMIGNTCNTVDLTATSGATFVTYGFMPAFSLSAAPTLTLLNATTFSNTLTAGTNILAEGAGGLTKGGFITTTGVLQIATLDLPYITVVTKWQGSAGSTSYTYYNIKVQTTASP